MCQRKTKQWAVLVMLAAFLVVSWCLLGCAPSPTAGITFTIALDTNLKVGEAYNIRYYPTTLLIDEQGIIRDIKVGAFRSKDELLTLLESLTSSEATSPTPGVAPKIGHLAPDFTLPTLGGGTVTLSELRGKWVLLNFWAIWCPPCRMEMPYLQAAFEEKGEEIEFIGINLGESREKVRQFAEGVEA